MLKYLTDSAFHACASVWATMLMAPTAFSTVTWSRLGWTTSFLVTAATPAPAGKHYSETLAHKLICSRFFAATELKAMLAHILINYDVKAETEGFRPPDDRFGVLRMPNLRGKIWIRKRAV
jgi:hypothetical protein